MVTPLPYTHPVAKVAFYVVLGTFGLLEWRIRLRSRLNREGSRADQGSLAVVFVTAAAGLTGAFVLAVNLHAAAIPDGRWPIFVAGLVLMVAGVAIRQWSVALLGRLFTVDVRVHPGQGIVEAGPYRWVRHPSYTGLILTLLGIGLALGTWASLAVLAVLPTAGLVVRIHLEERALLKGIGEPYRRFAATRARLVPGLW